MASSSTSTPPGPSHAAGARSRDLAVCAKRAFLAIEPWCQAQSDSDVPEVAEILKSARIQASAYIQATDKSLIVSRDGTAFAEDALHLCEHMKDGVESQKLLSCIGDLYRLAEDGHTKAEEVSNAFRNVWRGSMQITNSIISATATVAIRRQNCGKAAAAFGRGAQVAARFSKFCKPLGKAGVALAAAFPHFFIVLPAALPALEFAAQRLTGALEGRAQAHNQQVLSCNQALDQLWSINNDLMELCLGTEGFVQWWLSVKITLGSLRNHILTMSPDSVPGRAEMIKRKWELVYQEYTLYTREIRRLQDAYHPAITYLKDQGLFQDEPMALIPRTTSGLEHYEEAPDITTTLHLLAELGDKWWKTFAYLQRICDGATTKKCPPELLRLKNDIDNLGRSLEAIWTDLRRYLENIHPLLDVIRLRTSDAESADTVFLAPENWQSIVASAGKAQELYKSVTFASEKLPVAEMTGRRFTNLPQLDDVVKSLQSTLLGISTSIRELFDFFVSPHAIMQALTDNRDGGPGSWDDDVRRCIAAFSHL